MKKIPKVSIVTCTYNGERIIKQYLEKIFLQDFPMDNLEIILSDGGSNDKTLEIIKKFKKKYPGIIKLTNNPSKIKVGRGKGADFATREAKGEFLVLIDQDNLLFQGDWLSKMLKILEENPKISGVQSLHLAKKNSSLIDKYLNNLGIEDPFVCDYSLNSQIKIRPKIFNFNKKRNFFVYNVNKKNFFYGGDNGFMVRKKDFLENGGYTQDIDNFYRMATSNKKYVIAVPKKLRIHHLSSTNMNHLLNKKTFYGLTYVLKNYDGRDHYWFNLKKNSLKENMKFIKIIVINLMFFPRFIEGIKMSINEKDSSWMIHPQINLLITLAYIKSFIYSRFKKEVREVQI